AMLDPMPTYTVHVKRLDPTLAELHIEFADLPADVEVRGRVMGPRCPGMSTVEVAYPVQVVAHPVYFVLIPEPDYWRADRPCVYEGPVIFRRDGNVVGQIVLTLGIKAAG
ncbi:MAG: hypothetical protein HY289_02265, partial [Planctomycetes bacterium]|nr:hypothetical protein [Planctomycetota bacterium]